METRSHLICRQRRDLQDSRIVVRHGDAERRAMHVIRARRTAHGAIAPGRAIARAPRIIGLPARSHGASSLSSAPEWSVSYPVPRQTLQGIGRLPFNMRRSRQSARAVRAASRAWSVSREAPAKVKRPTANAEREEKCQAGGQR